MVVRSQLGSMSAVLGLVAFMALVLAPSGEAAALAAPATRTVAPAAPLTPLTPAVPAASLADELAGLPRPDVAGANDATIDSVTRLYLATFGRVPDPDGHHYWAERWLYGMDPVDMAASFMASPEFPARFGPVDDARFVELLYGHVLGRDPDPEGGDYWRSLLDGGTTRAEIVHQFAQSPEHVRRTGTTPPGPNHPPAPAGSGQGRRIVYSNGGQRVWLVETDGSIVDSYLVSGRVDTPDPGVYTVFSKSERAWAGHHGITMDHMVRFAYGRRLAIGFHSIPVYADGEPMQTLDQLGTYQSAGCVRQDPIKAELLYHWAEIGTTVVVLD